MTECEHRWVTENSVPSNYAQEVRQICAKCGQVRRTVLRPMGDRSGPSFKEVYEKFHGGNETTPGS